MEFKAISSDTQPFIQQFIHPSIGGRSERKKRSSSRNLTKPTQPRKQSFAVFISASSYSQKQHKPREFYEWKIYVKLPSYTFSIYIHRFAIYLILNTQNLFLRRRFFSPLDLLLSWRNEWISWAKWENFLMFKMTFSRFLKCCKMKSISWQVEKGIKRSLGVLDMGSALTNWKLLVAMDLA